MRKRARRMACSISGAVSSTCFPPGSYSSSQFEFRTLFEQVATIFVQPRRILKGDIFAVLREAGRIPDGRTEKLVPAVVVLISEAQGRFKYTKRLTANGYGFSGPTAAARWRELSGGHGWTRCRNSLAEKPLGPIAQHILRRNKLVFRHIMVFRNGEIYHRAR